MKKCHVIKRVELGKDYTCPVPKEKIQSLCVGDFIKTILCGQSLTFKPKEPTGERVWFKIRKIEPFHFEAQLDSYPCDLSASPGDSFDIQKDCVLEAMTEAEATTAAALQRREVMREVTEKING